MSPARQETLRLQPRRTAVAYARARIAELCNGLPREACYDAQLLTSELVTNAIRHGAGIVTVAIECDETSVAVAVGDSGPEMPLAPPVDVSAESGRGLRLVQAIAVSWGVKRTADQGKVVWFRIA